MAIVPDTKDWTWVLQRPCPECRLDTRSFPREQISSMLQTNARSWLEVLGRADLATRPAPEKWSPLEYACHVRDVCRIFNGRLDLMLTEDNPLFENWDQDATAVRDRYGEQDPAKVGVELTDAAHSLADRFATVVGEQWERPGRRSDGAHFTVESFGRYLVHDPLHHLYDVTGMTY